VTSGRPEPRRSGRPRHPAQAQGAMSCECSNASTTAAGHPSGSVPQRRDAPPQLHSQIQALPTLRIRG
jgi:hypothetical protein